MNLGEIRTESRRRLDDLAQPYFWSDEQLDELANDAQDQAFICSRMLDVAVTMAATADKASYVLPAHVFQVDEIRISTESHPLQIIARSQLDLDEPRWQEWASGTPQYAVIDPAGKSFRLVPAPNAAATLTISGYAVPSESQRMVSDTDEPILPSHLHKALVHWILAEAFNTRDADKGNVQLAEYNRQRFHQRFGDPVDASQLRTRQRQRGRRVKSHWM